jgi:hypothetical protein
VREQVKPQIGVGAVGRGQAKVRDHAQLAADPHPANLIDLLLSEGLIRTDGGVRCP